MKKSIFFLDFVLLFSIVLFTFLFCVSGASAEILVDDSGNHAGCGSSPGIVDSTSISTKITDINGNTISAIEPGQTFCFQAEVSALNCSDGLFFNKLRIFLGANNDNVHSSLGHPSSYAGTQCMGAQSCVNDSSSSCCSTWQENNEFMPNPPPGNGCGGDSCTRIFLGGYRTYQNTSCFDKVAVLNESQPASQLALISSVSQSRGSSADGSFYFIDELTSSDNSRMTACVNPDSLPVDNRGGVRIYYQYSGIHGKYFHDNKHWHWHIAYLPIYIYHEPEVQNTAFSSDYCNFGPGNGKITVNWTYHSSENRPQAKYKIYLMPSGGSGPFPMYDYTIDQPLANDQSESFTLDVGQTANYGFGGLHQTNFFPTLTYNKQYYLAVSVQDSGGNWSPKSVIGGSNIYTPGSAYPVNSFTVSPTPDANNPKSGQNVAFNSTTQFFDSVCLSNPTDVRCGYNWTFESGSPATSAVKSPTVVFSSTGVKQVSMRATDSNGNSCSAAPMSLDIKSAPANNPVAAIGCLSPADTNCRLVNLGDNFSLSNLSTDLDGQSDISQSEWFLSTSNSVSEGADPSTYSYVSKKVCPGATPPLLPKICDYSSSSIAAGKYFMKLVVGDAESHVSTPAYKYFEILSAPNQAPTAAYSCVDNSGVSLVPACTGYTGNFVFKNNSTDPDGSGDIKRSIWYIDGVAQLTCGADTSYPAICDYIPTASPGTHTVMLSIRDSYGHINATPAGSFTIVSPLVNSPQAAIGCTPSSCNVNQNASLILNNNSNDPDGLGNIFKSEWFINSASVLKCNMRLYYPFDGNSNDLSGNGNNGISSGTSTGAGKVGMAYGFISSLSSNVKSMSSVGINGDKPLTIALWVKPTASNPAVSGFGRAIIDWGGTASSHGLFIYYNSGTQKFEFGYNGNTGQTNSAFPSNIWNQIMYVYDGTNILLYVNGSLEGSINSVGPLNIAPGRVYIGVGTFAGTRYYSGMIDEVKIWSYPFTGSDAASYYSSGTILPPLCNYRPSTATTGDYLAGLTITDREGHTNAASQPYSVKAPNQSPQAAISCTPLSCGVFDRDPLVLNNNSTDPDGMTDIVSQKWYMKRPSDSDWTEKVYCSGNCLSSNPSHGPNNYCAPCTPQAEIGPGIWQAKVDVSDNSSQSSTSTTLEFRIKTDISAGFKCSLDGDSPSPTWVNCNNSFVAREGRKVYLSDTSVPSEGGGIVSRIWRKNGAQFGAGAISPWFTVAKEDIISGRIPLSLVVVDSNNRVSSISKIIGGTLVPVFMPKWKEIAPF